MSAGTSIYAGYHNLIIDVITGIGTQATITVYDAGTINLSDIYSNSTGTIKPNPFQTDINGRFFFYAIPSEYDIQVSGIGITTYKLEDVSIVKSFNGISGEHRIVNFYVNNSGKFVVEYDNSPIL